MCSFLAIVILKVKHYSWYCADQNMRVLHSGDGKTHYIQRKMKSSLGRQLTIAINESFSPVSVIQQLRSLPMESSHNVLYFSFTLLPPSVS